MKNYIVIAILILISISSSAQVYRHLVIQNINADEFGGLAEIKRYLGDTIFYTLDLNKKNFRVDVNNYQKHVGAVFQIDPKTRIATSSTKTSIEKTQSSSFGPITDINYSENNENKLITFNWHYSNSYNEEKGVAFTITAIPKNGSDQGSFVIKSVEGRYYEGYIITKILKKSE